MLERKGKDKGLDTDTCGAAYVRQTRDEQRLRSHESGSSLAWGSGIPQRIMWMSISCTWTYVYNAARATKHTIIPNH